MAHYPNGHSAYYGQSNSTSVPSSQSQTYQSQYATYASHQSPTQQEYHHELRRVPSYNAGDDVAFFDSPRGHNSRAADGNAGYPVQGGHGAGAGGYTRYNNTGTGQASLGSRHSQFSAASSQSIASRTSSHSSALSGYQHQYQPPASSVSSGQPAYNPQQFGRPHSQSLSHTPYNPQAYTGLSSAQYSSSGAGYQQYNPAAYQSTAVGGGYGRQAVATSPSHAQNYVQSPTTAYPQIPPPPPPRGPDHPYGRRHSGHYSDYSSDAQYGYSPTLAQPITSAAPRASTYTPVPSSPVNAAYSAGSTTSVLSYYMRGSHNSAYLPAAPGRTESSPVQEQPPEPPAHLSQSDQLRKRHSGSHPSPRGSLPTPPTYQTQSQLPPRRTDTLTRHPQSRPLPGPPPDADDGPAFSSAQNGSRHEEELTYDEIMREVEAAVMEGRPAGTTRRHSSRASRVERHGSTGEIEESGTGFVSSDIQLSPDERHTHTNGSTATGTGQYVNYDAYSDDSDAEAAAGLAMMRMADEEERAQAERRHARERSITTNSILNAYWSQSPVGRSQEQDPDSDSDFATHDLSLYGGGYEADMHYGDEPTYTGDAHGHDEVDHDRIDEDPLVDDAGHYSDEYEYPAVPEDPVFPPFSMRARVDTGGTGGLSEPSHLGRRMSFDDGDEGDGAMGHSHGEDRSGSESPDKGEPGDLFFHPGMRPLPPAPVELGKNANLAAHLMPAGTYRHREQNNTQPYGQYTHPSHPASPDSYGQMLISRSLLPRSTSLSSHSSTPRADPPIRSKTDADREKYRSQQELVRQQQTASQGLDATIQPSAITLDLPTIPAGRRKKFNPAKLSPEQFKKCSEPWALSAVVAWIRDLSEEETDLKEQAIIDAIVALFTHKVPTMNIADAETLGARVVNSMLEEGALVKDEEWVKFGPGTLSGVLYQITGRGCYSSRLHVQETEIFGRCYSHHCMRTLKKVNLKAQVMEPQRKAEDWVTFYKVPKEVWESYPKKEIDRQNNLHEIVTTEDAYIGQLDILRELYRDQLATMQPPVINPKRLNRFLNDVFGKVDAVKKVNEDHLLAQLKYRQKEQGPFIVGFSDIFREWIRKAKTAYIEYAATFPNANYLVRREAERNIQFRQFLNHARENKISNRLSWDTYLKAPITRIQRYTLLLSTVHKNMVKDSEEKTNLAQAIEEIKVVALECDNKVGEMSKKVDLLELSAKLQLRPEMKKEVELNLEHLGREIIFRGDLQRPGTRTRFNLVDTHAILFDHYLVLAKTVMNRDPSRTLKYETYDVSKLPIPMDLLVLESTNDDPVVKSSVKGISPVAPPSVALTHTNTSNSASSAGTASSGKTLVPSTAVDNPKDDKILYPFRIKHLGKTGAYTLYASSAQNRQEWCEKIIEAKTKHAASLFAQNAEPFRLRVLADTAFAYSDGSPGSKSVLIKGTPLDRAIREVEQRYTGIRASRPPPVCRAAVHCATVFQQPPGRMLCAIGTDYGVFISDYNEPRGWIRAIQIMRVTQIAVFEEFNLFLLIADKSLIAYHLDVVCPTSGVPSQISNDSARRAPQKLSGSREVGFFAAGRTKDRTLVFYKKRDGISSTFKVLEPVLQKSATSRSRFFPLRRGQTEFFREYDDFYIPAESYGINLFHSSLAISTHRGIEVLTLDKKQPWSVPNLRSDTPEAQVHLTSIANRIKDLRPLGMFRLSDSEFLVAYSECAVYVNKHGDVSRSVVMEFVGRAHTACLYGKFLILLNEDFVEVRNAMNGRLRQVIPGRNVVCLDDGSLMPGYSASNAITTSSVAGSANFNSSGGSTNGAAMATSGHTVKICMQHPEYERSQIVLELIENEVQKD
ncbi:hypothetical protein VTN02DRAFT_1872 [Thermoascus thermophilus]